MTVIEHIERLTKLNPLVADLAATRECFNRLFGRDDLWETEGVTIGGEWAPAVDIIENDHALTVKAELPGIEAKDVVVTVDNNVLTLKGERHMEKEVKKENYHRMERARMEASPVRSRCPPSSMQRKSGRTSRMAY